MTAHAIPLLLTSPDPSVYMTGSYAVLDLETTNRHNGNACDKTNSIVMAGILTDGVARAVPADEYTVGAAIGSLSRHTFTVGHNIKFDLKWLIRGGIDCSSLLVWDTMLAEYVIHGNQKKYGQLGLGTIAESYGLPGKSPYIDKCIKKGVCPSSLPTSLLAARAEYDIRTTEQVFLKQREIAEKRGLLPAIYTKCLTTVVLAYLELNGVTLDAQAVNDAYRDTVAEYNSTIEKLSVLTGGINPRSTKQLAEFIYDTLGFRELTKRFGGATVPDRTDKGARRTDADTIAALVPRTAKQREFIALKQQESKLGAMLSKTLNTFKAQIDGPDNILFANFNQTATVTHRLSSTGAFGGVQFQNMPRQFKKLVTARHKGWLVGEADYAQIEFRVAAFLGDDKVAREDIDNGADVHRFTASVLNSCAEADVTPEQRQDAKADTFKPLYAGESGTPQQRAYYEAFKVKYSGIASAQERWAAEVGANKCKLLPTGVMLYYPSARYDRNGRLNCKTEVYNHPIQYLATGEISLIGLVFLFHTLRAAKARSFITNTVHDAAVAEVHPAERELFAGCCRRSFVDYTINYLQSVYNICFDVPLKADVKIGTHWGLSTPDDPEIDLPEEIAA